MTTRAWQHPTARENQTAKAISLRLPGLRAITFVSTFAAFSTLAFGCLTFWPDWGRDCLPNPDATTQDDEKSPQREPSVASKKSHGNTSWHDPATIAGHEKCVDCHKPEIKSWMASKHFSRAFDLLRTSENALEYAKQLDIRPAEIASSSMCIKCHATQTQNSDHSLAIIPAVTCESCHGGSDGEEGWLNLHAVYGNRSTRRVNETAEHYAEREQECFQAGQLRSSQLYDLAKRCLECHVVGDEDLAEAGHAHGEGFEYVQKSMGEVRHNLFLDPNKNSRVATLWLGSKRDRGRTLKGRMRIMFLLGQMVDLEISLRNLSRGTQENDYTDELISRIEESLEILAEDVLEEVDDADSQEAYSSLHSVVKIVEPIWETLDDDGFDFDEIENYLKASQEISRHAKAFSRQNGSGLSAVDTLELFEDDGFEGVYQPAGK